MTNDRNYLRMLSDYALWNYAQEQGKTELEFVMAERLHALNDEIAGLEAAQAAIEDLQAEIAALKTDVAELQEELDAVDREAANATYTD